MKAAAASVRTPAAKLNQRDLAIIRQRLSEPTISEARFRAKLKKRLGIG